MSEPSRSAAARPLPAERVFSLVATLLAAGRPLTREEIMERLLELYVPLGTPEPEPETLRKMFERDKRLLKDMGLPLVTVEPGQPGGEDLEDGTSGYRIDENDLHVPGIHLSDSQRLLLLGVAETLLDAPGFPLRDDLAVAVHKILMADEEAGDGGAADSFPCRFVLEQGARDRPGGQRGLIEEAYRAVDECRSLVLRYRAAAGEVTERVVDPYGLAPVDGSWLLTGHCHLRGARRTFAMHRVLDLRRLHPQSGGPDFEHPADFDAAQVTRVRPWQYEVHDPLEVVLEVDEDFAWHASSLIGCTPDGAGRMRLVTSNAGALVEIARAYGPRVRVVSPPGLRTRVIEEMRGAGVRLWNRVRAPGRRPRAPAGEPSSGPAPGPSRRDDSTRRLRRFLFIIAYLSRHPEAEVKRLCSILEVDERTLLSDLERLSLCGVYPSTDFQLFDISVDRGSGTVRFRRNPVPGLERPVRLTRREAVALLLGFKLVRDGIAPPFDWAADQVMEEIVGAAGRELIEAVGEMEKRISLASRHTLSWDTFYEVSMAVCERRRLEIEYYTKSRDAIGRRVVRPYVLVCTLGRWYLLGLCEWRRDVRTFRMDRIRSAVRVDGTFTLPAGFDPGTHLGGGIHASSDPREEERVVVALDPAFIEECEGREGMEFLAARRGNEITFAVPPDRHEGFLTWLLSFTARFSVVHPAALDACVQRRRERVLAAYGG